MSTRSAVHNAARAYVKAGLSVIPILPNGTKAPDGKLLKGSWSPYQTEIADLQTIDGWFSNIPDHGLAVIGGKVSGGLEILDFDDPSAYDEWLGYMAEYDTEGLLARLPHVTTPSGGKHIYYRCEVTEGNKKLAHDAQHKIRIETRGEGGYVVAPPSPGACHPSGKPYVRGTVLLTQIPTISPDERDVLLAFARLLNEHVEPETVIGGTSRTKDGVLGERPGDEYNVRGDYESLLERHGWRRFRTVGNKTLWTRPEKSKGISATSNYANSNLFYVFSSNAFPFHADKSYSPFGVYATLAHGGDYQAAAKALGEEGYGMPPTRCASQLAPFTPVLKVLPAEPMTLTVDAESELATVAAMLVDREAIETAVRVLSPEDFATPEAQALYRAIVNLDTQNKRVDRVIVQNELARMGSVVPPDLLDRLPAYSVAANIGQYVGLVADLSRRRQFASTLALYHAKSSVATNDPEALKESLLADLVAMGRPRGDVGFVRADRIMDEEVFPQAAEARKTPGKVSGLKTGLTSFDKVTKGLQRGNLILVAGRPSMGKTSFAMSIAEHVALKERKAVAFFTLEMSSLELSRRMACSQAMLDGHNLLDGTLSEDEWAMMEQFRYRLRDKPLYFNDTTNGTVEAMHSELRRLTVQHPEGIGLILVDYVQLMRSARRIDNRNLEIGEIARGLKRLSREFSCPMIALSQLSRDVEKRENKRPVLSDLRESGALEQEADMVVFLYREQYYKNRQALEDGEAVKRDKNAQEEAEAIAAKYRNGPTGFVKVGFIPAYSKFVPIDTQRTDDPGPTGL